MNGLVALSTFTAAGTPGSINRPPIQYKGADLEPERGPGLGCFRFQLIVLGALVILTPISVVAGWPEAVSAVLLFVVIALLCAIVHFATGSGTSLLAMVIHAMWDFSTLGLQGSGRTIKPPQAILGVAMYILGLAGAIVIAAG